MKYLFLFFFSIYGVAQAAEAPNCPKLTTPSGTVAFDGDIAIWQLRNEFPDERR